MTQKIIYIFLFLSGITFLITGHVYADEPPSWETFEICSLNGLFCAAVSDDGKDDIDPWDRHFTLTITDSGGNKVWSTSYDYGGYPDGGLTDDGDTFFYVNFWYHPDIPVVKIYRKNNQFDVLGSDFNLSEINLINTVSHQLWLSRDEAAIGLIDNESLLIITIDGQSHRIDFTTGKIRP